MTRFNLQSVSFALLVLALVSIGRGSGSDSGRVPQTQEADALSFTAQVKAVAEISLPEDAELESPAPPAVSHGEATIAVGRTLTSLHPESARPKVISPTVIAAAAFVGEIGNPYPLFEKNTESRWALASLTKLMTALVAKKVFSSGETIIITPDAIAEEGNAGGFREGEMYTAKELIEAMLVTSSNDAAFALAEHYGFPKFLEEMRRQTVALGMQQTSFFDVAGLSVLNQGTAWDLERLATFLLETHPEILEITAKPTTAITELGTQMTRKLQSTNRFAGTPGFIGGKTGYTGEAGGNLISVFDEKGRRFLIIVFGSDDRFSETETLRSWIRNNFTL